MARVKITDDYYRILEVEESVSTDEIARSYKRLALKVHPDRNKDEGATAAFQLLLRAYETLSDETKRRSYDIHDFPAIKKARPPPTWANTVNNEVDELAQLETMKYAIQQSRQARVSKWSARKSALESSISELKRELLQQDRVGGHWDRTRQRNRESFKKSLMEYEDHLSNGQWQFNVGLREDADRIQAIDERLGELAAAKYNKMWNKQSARFQSEREAKEREEQAERDRMFQAANATWEKAKREMGERAAGQQQQGAGKASQTTNLSCNHDGMWLWDKSRICRQCGRQAVPVQRCPYCSTTACSVCLSTFKARTKSPDSSVWPPI